MMWRACLFVAGLASLVGAGAKAQTAACGIQAATLTTVETAAAATIQAADANGGIFKPNRVWVAVVDRQGKLCGVVIAGADPWPSSRAAAIALAESANGFSNSGLALSTANLYGQALPGGEFYGIGAAFPFNPTFDPQNSGTGFVPGGTLVTGGGVALYSGGQVIGGLGVSGDSSCANHAIAYRTRRSAGLDGIPGGVGPSGNDNIFYAAAAGPTPGSFTHPHCFPTDITP